jgi:hypothetical protein
MMAARQPATSAVAMKMILMTTTRRLAAVLAYFRGMHANWPRREGLVCKRRQHMPLATDPSRIPAYLRRRRLPLRGPKSRFDVQALGDRCEAVR